MSVTEIDRGWNRIKKELRLIDKSYVKVGVLSEKSEDYPDKEYKEKTIKGAGIAEVAAANEFGVPSKNIPARPFMAQAFDKEKGNLGKKIGDLFKKILEGATTTRHALAELGADHVGNVQGIFATGEFQKNAESTLRQKTVRGKKGIQPLIDTGHLRQSIHYEVKLK